MMLIRLFFLSALLLVVSACGPTESQSTSEAPAGWPELESLVHQVHELQAVLDMEDNADLLAQQVGRVLGAISTLQTEGVPSGIAQPERVQRKVEELQALSVEIQRTVDDLEAAPLSDVHPLVMELTEVAEMPQVQAEPDHPDHDHAHGHDH
ncbi:MAG: hypothetical protein PF795_00215 [Kiritimatiellae bacterium]|jgi:hypothetical protein|nr:hypothetical protein [Kiritimatiellia bacterium]